MNMLTMLAILTVLYFVTLLLICIYRYKINIKIGNLIFAITDFVFFMYYTLFYYIKNAVQQSTKR